MLQDLSPRIRNLVGASALLLIAYFVLFLRWVDAHTDRNGRFARAPDHVVLLASLVYVVVALATLAVCVIHAAGNPALSERAKALWITALGLLCPLTLPAYWWRHLRR